MDAWAIVVIVVAALIFAALAFGLVKRVRGRVGDVEVDVQAAEQKRKSRHPRKTDVRIQGSEVRDAKVKASGGANVEVGDSVVDKSRIIGKQ